MREVIAAIREGMPDADQMPPGQYFSTCSGRLRTVQRMTDEEEFAARSQLKWTREGDARILLYRLRRMGRVVPDKGHPRITAIYRPTLE
jgi:hypothetical protein